MIYLTSITILFTLLLIVTAIGRRLVVFLPEPVGNSSGFYVAPILGLATLVLITTLYGWISPFRTSISMLLFFILLIFCFFVERKRSELVRDWMAVSMFAVLATLPVLAPAIRFDSFNPFNDTYTYLVHAQWLQEHAFSETARASGFFPSETQILMYQLAGSRMGASFFLAYVQSLYHLEWSYYAYLPVVSLAFALGCLAIGGVIQQVIRIQRGLALALGLLPVISLNGFVFGAQCGFLPQTFGLAFCAGIACLFPALILHALGKRSSWEKEVFYLLPLSIVFSALLVSYNDIFPVVGPGFGLFALLIGLLYRQSYLCLGRLIFLIFVEVIVIVNVESIRIFKNFIDTLMGTASGALQFGWPIKWITVQYLAHTFGMKSPLDSNSFAVDRIFSIWIFPVVLLGILFLIVKIWREQPKNPYLILIASMNIIFALAFVKFSYEPISLAGGFGYSFLKFKLSKWLSPFNLSLMGIALAWIISNGLIKLHSAIRLLGVVTFSGLVIHFYVFAHVLTKPFQIETMQKYSAFEVFLDLRSRLSSISPDKVIYIDIPFEHHKVTQMITYVLSDHRLASKYEDGYLRKYIPEDEREMPKNVANWIIELKPTVSLDENPLSRVGPFLITQAH